MKRSDLTTINGRFRQIRVDAGLTQAEFGGMLSLTRMGVNAIETGRYNPTLDVIILLRKKFRKTYNWIIDGVEVEGEKTVELLKSQIESLIKTNADLVDNNAMLRGYINEIKKPGH